MTQRFSEKQKARILTDLLNKSTDTRQQIVRLVDSLTDDAEPAERETEALALIHFYCEKPRQLKLDYNRYYAGPLAGIGLETDESGPDPKGGVVLEDEEDEDS